MQVTDLLGKLSAVLSERFDPRRTDSVQSQISQLVTGATADQVRALSRDLLGETGPLTVMNEKVVTQLKLVSSTTQDVVTRVAALAEQIEGKLKLDDAQERSTQKGASFEEVLNAELDAIHGPLGDECVAQRTTMGACPTPRLVTSSCGSTLVRLAE